MSTPQNDWAAVLLNISNNDNINLGENAYATLYSNGITPDTTTLKDKEYYKNVPQVVNAFTEDNKFNNDAFEQFYDSALRSFNEFAEIPYVELLLDEIGTTPYDSSRLYNPSKVRDFSAVLTPWHDRNRSTYGTSNIWEKGSKTFSDREVAQANFVRDSEGNVLDWTPNDKAGLFSGLFAPAMAYATYEDDVYDEEGRLIHMRGETKLDENGDPYCELLGDKPAYGQDIVRWTDIMSIDGSLMNKYVDVFDSDGLEKSMTKTIAKTALMLAPYFTPAGKAMGWINASVGLLTALPTLVKSLDGLIAGGSDNKFIDSVTSLENIMGRFKPTTSDEARGRFWSVENIGDLIVSSSGQLFSQRNIANKLYEMKPFANQELNKKFAQWMSTGYMAMTSVSDVYGDMKNAGASDRVAGFGSLLSLAGFYTLLQQGYFKNKLIEGSLLDEDQKILHSLRGLTEWATTRAFADTVKTATKQGTKSALKNAWQFIKTHFSDAIKGTSFGPRAYISRSLNEGIEETMEEIMIDSVKWLANGLDELGFEVTDDGRQLDFGRTFGNVMERWGTSFLGGFLGGAVFEAHTQRELSHDAAFQKWKKSTPIQQLYQYVAEGEADKLRELIRKNGNKGLNGNKNLSARYKSIVGDQNGTKVYGVGTESDNQNLAMTNALLAIVDNAESIYSKHNMIWTNDELLKKVLASESVRNVKTERGFSDQEMQMADLVGDKQTAEAVVEAIINMKDDEGNALGEAIATNILHDINGIRSEVFDLEQRINAEEAKETNESEDDKPRKKYIAELKKQRDALTENFNSLINGNKADALLTQILMFFEGNPLDRYMGFGSKKDLDDATNNIERYSQLIHKIDYANADDEVKEFVEDSYRNFKTQKSELFRRIADLHISLSDIMRDDLKSADSMLSDVIVSDKYLNRHHKKTIYEENGALVQQIDLIKMRIEQMSATDPDFKNSPEYQALSMQLDKAERQHAYFRAIMERDGNMTLEQWFDYDLPNDMSNIQSQLEKQANILDFYKNAVNDKALFVDSKFLQAYLDRLNFNPIRALLADYVDRFGGDENNDRMFFNLAKVDPNLLGMFNNEIIGDLTNRSEVLPSGYTKSQEAFAYLKENGGDDLVQALVEKNIFTQKLQDRFDELIAALKTNLPGVRQKYADLVKMLDDNVDFESLRSIEEFANVKNGEDFINHIFTVSNGDVGGGSNNVLQFAIETLGELDKLQTSPVYEWLQKVHTLLFGTNSKIFDIIANERSNLVNLGVDVYMMGESAAKDVQNAEGVLNIIMGLIEASSPANLNELINTKRQGYKNLDGSNKQDFTIISDNTKEVLGYELEFIISQLESLKHISDFNSGNKLVEEKNIAKVDLVKRFNAIVRPSSGTFGEVLHTLLKGIGFDFTDYEKQYDIENVKNWSDDSFNDFYKLEFDFKNKLHEAFKKLSEADRSKFLKDLIEGCKSRIAVINMEIDEFSDNINELGDWGLLRYFLANITTSYSEFNSLYKNAVDKTPDFLPFSSQEFIVRDAYASYVASDVYSEVLSGLCEHFKNQAKPENKAYADLFKVIKNFFFVDGVPGSGKTTAVAKIFVEVLKAKYGNDLAIITLTHTNEDEIDENGKKINRSAKFGNALGSSSNNQFLHNDFIERFICKGLTDAKKTDHGHSSKFEEKNLIAFSELDKHLVSNPKHILIISDEHTFANEEQIKAISKYSELAPDKKIYILGLGDLFQSGVQSTSDITDTYFQSSVRLTNTFRAERQGKVYNERLLRDILKGPMKRWSQDRANIQELDLSREVLEGVKSVFSKAELIGYKDQFGISGDIEVSSVEDTLNSLLPLKAADDKVTIAIVTDNESKYASYKEQGVVVKSVTEAQGGQWDYVIVDTHIDLATDSKAYHEFKKFYMLMTRAKKGTAWLENTVDIVKFKGNDQSAAKEVAKDMKIASKAREQYVEWRKKLFDLVGTPTSSDNTTSNTGSNTESNTPTGTTTDNSNTSTDGNPDSGTNINPDSGINTANQTPTTSADVYTPVQEGDVEMFRNKYYEPETLSDYPEFEESSAHRYYREEYHKRKNAIMSSKAFDYDTWIKFIDDPINLVHDCARFSSDKYNLYKKFLYGFNAILMDYLSIKDNKDPFVFTSKLGELRSLEDNGDTIAKLVSEIINSHATAVFTIKRKGDSIIVYYEYQVKNDKWESIPITALANTKENEDRVNLSYPVSTTTTSVSSKMIPISSNGERFIRMQDIRPNVTTSSKLLIYKGYSDQAIEQAENRFTEKFKSFNKNNRGKAFVLVGNLSRPVYGLDFSNWPKEIGKHTITTEAGEQIAYIIDESRNVYVSLAGIQYVCTTKTLESIIGKVKTAYLEQNKESYRNICVEIAKAIQGDGALPMDLPNKYKHSLYSDNDNVANKRTLRSVFPTNTWRYLQSLLVSIADTNSPAFSHLAAHLNSNNQAVLFKIPNKSDLYLTVYSKDNPETGIPDLYVTTSNYNNGIKIGSVSDYVNGDKSLRSVMTDVLKAAVHTTANNKDDKIVVTNVVEYLKNQFGVSETEVDALIHDKIKKGEFEIEFRWVSENDGNSFQPAGLDKIFLTTFESYNDTTVTIFEHLLKVADKLRSGRVNLNIFIDEYGTGELDIFGTSHIRDGMGFDVVEVLPTNYGFTFSERATTHHKYNGDSDSKGMTHHDRTYRIENGDYIFTDGPTVNKDWLNTFGIRVSDSELKIERIKHESDGTTLITFTNAHTAKVTSVDWLSDYTSLSFSSDGFKKDAKTQNTTYDSKPFTLIGFSSDKTKVVIGQDEKIITVPISTQTLQNLNGSDNEVIHSDERYVIVKDSSNKAKVVHYVDGECVFDDFVISNNLLVGEFEYNKDLDEKIGKFIGDEILQAHKKHIKSCLDEIRHEQADVPMIANDELKLFDELSNITTIGNLSTSLQSINEKLEQIAYILGIKYTIALDSTVRRLTDPYNLARNMKDRDQIVKIEKKDGKFFVYLRDKSIKTYVDENGKLREIVENQDIQKLEQFLIDHGVDEDLITKYIRALKSNKTKEQNRLFGLIISMYNFGNDQDQFTSLTDGINKC